LKTSKATASGPGQLQQQLQDETEEECRKRLAQQNMLARANPAMSPSTMSLFQTMAVR
jgi:hypothetical protein